MRRYNKVLDTLDVTSTPTDTSNIITLDRYKQDKLIETILYLKEISISERTLNNLKYLGIENVTSIYVNKTERLDMFPCKSNLKNIYLRLDDIEYMTNVASHFNYNLVIDSRFDLSELDKLNVKIYSILYAIDKVDNISIMIDNLISILNKNKIEHIIIKMPSSLYMNGVLNNFKTRYSNIRITFIVVNNNYDLASEGFKHNINKNNKPFLTPTAKTWSHDNLECNRIFYDEREYLYVNDISVKHNNTITIMQYRPISNTTIHSYYLFLLHDFCNKYVNLLNETDKEKKSCLKIKSR